MGCVCVWVHVCYFYRFLSSLSSKQPYKRNKTKISQGILFAPLSVRGLFPPLFCAKNPLLFPLRAGDLFQTDCSTKRRFHWESDLSCGTYCPRDGSMPHFWRSDQFFSFTSFLLSNPLCYVLFVLKKNHTRDNCLEEGTLPMANSSDATLSKRWKTLNCDAQKRLDI